MIIDKTKPHAVFLDIDGTLMAPGKLLLLSEGKIPPKNIWKASPSGQSGMAHRL